MSAGKDPLLDVPALQAGIAALLRANGVSEKDAAVTASSLISAEVEGVSSHGVALVPLYVEHLAAGGVNANAKAEIVDDLGALVVMTANHSLGQASSQVAVDIAIERAKKHGIAMVTVRNGFHFGTAAFWAKQFASKGMVGVAMSNTRPLMPAPGGAERLVGNNPLAIAFPSAEGLPLVVDMAMSASAMGKIRIADAKGEPIPLGWATNEAGDPTTNAADAIKGMLLPAAGPKGFGLAVAIDLLCGAMSNGAFGSAVKPLYGPGNQQYDCSHAFIAINAQALSDGGGIGKEVTSFAQQIRNSATAPGIDTIFAPGDLERARRKQREAKCPIPQTLIDTLNKLGSGLNPPISFG